GGGREQRAAVDPLAQAARGELAQVAADRVLGDPELDREVGGDDPAVAAQALEDPLLALARQRGGGRLRPPPSSPPPAGCSSRSAEGDRKWMPWMPSAAAASTFFRLSSMNTARAGSTR